MARVYCDGYWHGLASVLWPKDPWAKKQALSRKTGGNELLIMTENL